MGLRGRPQRPRSQVGNASGPFFINIMHACAKKASVKTCTRHSRNHRLRKASLKVTNDKKRDLLNLKFDRAFSPPAVSQYKFLFATKNVSFDYVFLALSLGQGWIYRFSHPKTNESFVQLSNGGRRRRGEKGDKRNEFLTQGTREGILIAISVLSHSQAPLGTPTKEVDTEEREEKSQMTNTAKQHPMFVCVCVNKL